MLTVVLTLHFGKRSREMTHNSVSCLEGRRQSDTKCGVYCVCVLYLLVTIEQRVIRGAFDLG